MKSCDHFGRRSKGTCDLTSDIRPLTRSVRFCLLVLVAGLVFVAVVMATWTGPHHLRSRPSPEQAQDAPLIAPPPDPRPRLGHVTCGRGLRRSSDPDLRLDSKPRPDCDTDPKLKRATQLRPDSRPNLRPNPSPTTMPGSTSTYRLKPRLRLKPRPNPPRDQPGLGVSTGPRTSSNATMGPDAIIPSVSPSVNRSRRLKSRHLNFRVNLCYNFSPFLKDSGLRSRHSPGTTSDMSPDTTPTPGTNRNDTAAPPRDTTPNAKATRKPAPNSTKPVPDSNPSSSGPGRLRLLRSPRAFSLTRLASSTATTTTTTSTTTTTTTTTRGMEADVQRAVGDDNIVRPSSSSVTRPVTSLHGRGFEPSRGGHSRSRGGHGHSGTNHRGGGGGLSRRSLARTSSSSSSKTRGSDRCHLNLVEVRVSDLQLGFQSDEVISFQFCSGSCLHARSNYDLALSRVIHLHLPFAPIRRRRRNQQQQQQEKQQVEKKEQASVEEVSVRMRRRVAGEGVNSEQPCCRPAAFEDVTFQNSEHKWQTVADLSAKRCKCVL
ncbi:mucin-5AC-like [Lethenteron reissneri]|uniref:mucin-5AC-like n=1 Tax=Lethenteron reissneri TaxID=7753 RepID=UPI002AB660AF|nr:mucin-5AC-like [Lethenteron reissneri]